MNYTAFTARLSAASKDIEGGEEIYGTEQARIFAKANGVNQEELKAILELTEWKIKNYTNDLVRSMPLNLSLVQGKVEPSKNDGQKKWSKYEILHLGLCAEMKEPGQLVRTLFLVGCKSRTRQSMKNNDKSKLAEYFDTRDSAEVEIQGIWCPAKGGFKF